MTGLTRNLKRIHAGQAADVANPARSEWPAKRAGSSPMRCAWRLTTNVTARAVSRVEAT